MCKGVTNTRSVVHCHAYILYLFLIFLLVRQVHQQIILPMCGWREVRQGLHLCWHLRRFSVKQGERNTDVETEWIGRGGQRERERGRDSEREEWKGDRRYIWLCGCVKYQGMHHNCGFFSEQPDVSMQQQDIIGRTKCVILYFKTVGAVSAESDRRDIFKDKMETVLLFLPHGFH